jgi:cell division transport system permease protein
MFLNLKRSIKSSFKFIFRNWGITLVNILILTITLFLFSSLLLFEKSGKIFLKEIEEKADFSVYFKEEVPEEEILKIKDELLKSPEVERVEFISKEKALASFKERHKDNPILMEALREVGNPFLASLNIKLKNPTLFEKVSNFFKEKENFVEKMDFFQRQPLIEKIFSITETFKKGMIALILFFLFISFLVVFTTLHLSILNYKEEIFTQKLVGAPNWMIYFPFLFQGIFAGFLASLISTLILFLGLFFLSPKFSILFPEIEIFNILKDNLSYILLYQILIGVFWGFLCSFLATKRHLEK